MIAPAANVDETDNEYILTIASPGFRREDFRLLIEKNIISIAAEREPSQVSCLHDHCEYDYPRWKRDFLLPEDAEALLATAQYKNGELVIRIPRGKIIHSQGSTHIYVY